ncbi:MAG: CBS domain-containing protein [Candidatus Dadabacteria bacterium]
MFTIKEIIKTKPVLFNTIEHDTPVFHALHLLKNFDTSYLVVLNQGEFLGLFSERDYSRKLILRGRSSKETKVSEVLTRDVPVISINDDLETCLRLMNAHKSRYLLVFDDKQELNGVLTMDDLIEHILDAPEKAAAKRTTQYRKRSIY